MAGELILIVEDNPVNQKLIITVLRPHGYRMITAGDGEEAVRMACEMHPDLILMDLQIPKLNGFAATQRIKEIEATRQIPVVALTAHAMPRERSEAERLNFDGYITKPIDTRIFPDQVLEYLDRVRR